MYFCWIPKGVKGDKLWVVDSPGVKMIISRDVFSMKIVYTCQNPTVQEKRFLL